LFDPLLFIEGVGHFIWSANTKPQGGYITLKMGDIAWAPYFHFVCRRHISEIKIVSGRIANKKHQ